jgi:transposase
MGRLAMTIRVRALSAEEQAELTRMARSRTLCAGRVKRAQLVLLAVEGHTAKEIAAILRLHARTARFWLKRFNAHGLAGLEESDRPGRPPVYPAEQVGAVVEAALTCPADLGLPFASWTLDRLAAYLSETKGIAMRRSRIGEILAREGLRWRQEETWFGVRVDPDFARKRGRSSSSTPPRPRVAPSFASTRWARKPAGATPAAGS